MIRSFRCTETAGIFERKPSRRLPQDIQPIALRKLRMIHHATNLNDLRLPPANRLERLHGDRAGQYSVRNNDRWRLCFEWRGADAFNVEIVDYH